MGHGNVLARSGIPGDSGPEYTLHTLDYVLGRHPASNVAYSGNHSARNEGIFGTIVGTKTNTSWMRILTFVLAASAANPETK